MSDRSLPPKSTTAETGPSFSEFGLDPTILSAVDALGFVTTTPVQAQVIPPLLKGRDLIGQARTGSGKTAAFGLPMLERFKEGGTTVRGLVLTPTRELAIQVAGAIRGFAKGLPIPVVAIYGGAPYPPQLKALKDGAAIVVGTPGRVIDHLERKTLDLGHVEMMVLDEADEMLRMGFLEAVERVLESLPEKRQIALLSATMPKPIERVTQRFLRNPITIQVEARALSVDHIEQQWIRVHQHRKLDVLTRILQGDPHGATLIFTRTRRGCAEVADGLSKRGIAADAIHGDLNQVARERVINRLRSKRLSVLVATDVAARGLDVSHLTRVINFDFPQGAEAYVHRIGRTGRAGAKGSAITLVTPSQQGKLRFLKKTIRFDIRETHPPSNADIALLQRSELWTELESKVVDTDLTDIRSWLGAAALEAGMDPESVASAAIHLLARQRHVHLFPPPDAPGSRSSKPNQSGDKSTDDRARLNEVELFLGIGWKAGIRPADIVGALTNEGDIPGTEIGRISIFDRKAFVGLPRAVGDKILAGFPTLTIRGKEVHVSMARPRGGGGEKSERSSPRPRPYKKKAPFHPRKGKGRGKKKGEG